MIIVRLLGGMGNQMFQYACAKYLAYCLKTRLVIDPRFLSLPFYTAREYCLDAFDIKESLFSDISYQELPEKFTSVEEASHLRFDMSLSEYISKNTYLSGYWQSWKYFQEINPLIRKRFRFSAGKISETNLRLSEIIRQINSVSIHVRRDDYLLPQFKFIDVLPIDYYKKAISYITNRVENPVFYIFSDDPEWVRNNLEIPFETHAIEGNTNIEDLYLMSQCKHNIIANSTYSWWGAWLNTFPDKIVIAPKMWLIGSNIKVENTDIIPPEWVCLY